MFIILSVYVQCLCGCLLLRKSVIYKWENQLLSRQIEVIKLHFLNDYLMKIELQVCMLIYMSNRNTLDLKTQVEY